MDRRVCLGYVVCMFGKNNQKMMKAAGILIAILIIVSLLVSYLPFLM